MADGERRPDTRPDGGLLQSSPDHGTWTSDELQTAVRRVDALTRELHRLETTMHLQQEEVARLQDTLQVVEGRTTRHEVGQEQTREVRQEMAELEERLAQEASLRRDLVARVERFQHREAETEVEIHRALQLILSRLDEADGRATAESLRQRQIAGEVAEVEHDGEDLVTRVEALERRFAAEQESGRHVGTEIAQLASSVAQLKTAVDAMEVRSRAIAADQRRIDEAVASVRATRDHEAELRELVEQQRATRARLEDRLAAIEETQEALRRELADTAEERALMARQLAGGAEQRRELLERLEAQRDTFVEHLRRQVRADEERHRRSIEEMGRDIRIARSLLVRLLEETDEAEQEQPL